MRHLLFCLCMLAGLWAAPGFAQVQPQDQPAVTQQQDSQPLNRRRLMVPPKNADGTIKVTPFFEDPVLWIRDQQQNFYGGMSKAMKDMKQGGSHQAAWFLLWLSLGYGVFHAAGPGHGKTVISGWLLATETQLRRGILVAFMSAIVQALVAIIVVSGALLLLEGATSAAKNMAGYLESLSYGLIAIMGAYLLWTGLLALLPRVSRKPVSVGAAAVAQTHHFEIVNPLPASHVHSHIDGADCDCGHAHAPSPKDVTSDWSWKRALSLSFAVGVRPCTGALLVLLFANALGIYWAGIAATFVMALGTFATVAAIASIAVYSKKLANRMASRNDAWMQRLNIALRLCGGAMILGLGIILSIGALSGSMPDSF
ncbi:nickel/cobalt transporter [Aestuariivirga litoralis]|uniref:nickel/cobalt transporter n=1 Tax=Aestuariivirga litoralis TaxID=2650924 RepID=UPI0018C7F874|nr:nickel/cobalt transporter [Aestuariivirga litoralis]